MTAPAGSTPIPIVRPPSSTPLSLSHSGSPRGGRFPSPISAAPPILGTYPTRFPPPTTGFQERTAPIPLSELHDRGNMPQHGPIPPPTTGFQVGSAPIPLSVLHNRGNIPPHGHVPPPTTDVHVERERRVGGVALSLLHNSANDAYLPRRPVPPPTPGDTHR